MASELGWQFVVLVAIAVASWHLAESRISTKRAQGLHETTGLLLHRIERLEAEALSAHGTLDAAATEIEVLKKRLEKAELGGLRRTA